MRSVKLSCGEEASLPDKLDRLANSLHMPTVSLQGIVFKHKTSSSFLIEFLVPRSCYPWNFQLVRRGEERGDCEAPP